MKQRAWRAVLAIGVTAAVIGAVAEWRILFAWPDGIVVGNLIASALWAAPALVHLHRKLDRHHAEHMAAVKSAGEGK